MTEMIPSIGAFFVQMVFVVGALAVSFIGFRATTSAQVKQSTTAIMELAKEVRTLHQTVNELKVELACLRTERKGDEARLRRLEKKG